MLKVRAIIFALVTVPNEEITFAYWHTCTVIV
jgi:hypothetical protein